ncbi:protein kinase [Streptomyces sp. NPDC056480]|uniref:serine/threonine-protein kinase n=1 Tax=Streptomyces sp. NPDC056480 TaxID=3345833 RepID=UPI0036CB6238
MTCIACSALAVGVHVGRKVLADRSEGAAAVAVSNGADSTWAVPGYAFICLLGTGSTGRVVEAADLRTGAGVAIKYLGDTLRNESLRGILRAEARMLSAVSSPHVVRLHDYIETPQGAAIVMELVRGASLRSLLRTQGPALPEAALVILKGSLLGLAAVHDRGLVHRDYKPENVLVTAEGVSKLTDFGISAYMGEATRTAGTPAYMSPEQWHGGHASPSSDIYAASVTFFECLTGRKPFEGLTWAELAVQHTEAEIPKAGVPQELLPILERGMAKSPEQRPQNGRAFIEELEAAAAAAYGRKWEARGKRALAALLSLLGTETQSPVHATGDAAFTSVRMPGPASEGTSKPVRRAPVGAAVSAAAVVALSAAAIAMLGVDREGRSDAGQVQMPLVTITRPGVPSSAVAGEDQLPSRVLPSAASAHSAGPSAGQPGVLAVESPAGSLSSLSEASPTSTRTPTPAPSPPFPSPAAATSDRPAPPAATLSDSPAPPAPEHQTAPPSSNAPAPEAAVTFASVSEPLLAGGRSARAQVVVTAENTAPITLTVRWYNSSSDSTTANPGSQDGAPQTFVLSGRTSYTIDAAHQFLTRRCHPRWSVLVSTDPPAHMSRPFRLTAASPCQGVR